MSDFRLKDDERRFGSDLPKCRDEKFIAESFSSDTPLWKIKENMPTGATVEERDGKYVVRTPMQDVAQEEQSRQR